MADNLVSAMFRGAGRIFNLVPCDNEFEKEFAKFLEKSPDVERFAKLPQQFGFVIEYTDAAGNLRYYEPDFVAVLSSGDRYHPSGSPADTTSITEVFFEKLRQPLRIIARGSPSVRLPSRTTVPLSIR
jgi:hypothetical protein